MQAIGWVGFALFQVFYVPQTVKILRTRQVVGLSLLAWTILWLGMLCYVIYSAQIGDLVFMVGNGVGLAQTSLQLGLILRYRRQPIIGP